ncbi:N6-adenosine-methyltransferase subunit [Thelohanellus kitauei]|uniref:N(6)-adenosine-methyltransferase non-catalytic subunit METTL14 n=1 Tax=Thelohanellus kitauei TaxID=669202 RepID=A0A0C2N0S0_THEKT|nr:N6-adenosine-methyltransferase subunit [Thelohanellus kitauei]
MDVKTKIEKKIKMMNEKSEELAKKLNLGSTKNLDILIGRNVKTKSKKYPNYNFDIRKVPDVLGDEIFKSSKKFLTGTITGNPQNDYSQNFVDTGDRPQNFIMDTSMKDRYLEYPKLRELMRLKDELTINRGLPPLSIKADLRTFDLKSLKNVFDVILIQPPLKEYLISSPSLYRTVDLWDWDEVLGLDIESISSNRAFIFLWCGSYDGLEKGRYVFSFFIVFP